MVFTCLFMSPARVTGRRDFRSGRRVHESCQCKAMEVTRRGMALDDGDAFIALGPADPSRSARAVAPPTDPSRCSGGCARPPPFGGESCPSSRAALLPVSTGFPGPTHLAAARG